MRAFVAGCGILAAAQSAIHELDASILFLISTTLFHRLNWTRPSIFPAGNAAGVSICRLSKWQSLHGLSWVCRLVFMAAPILANAQFTYSTNNGTITIEEYTGSGGMVSIPSTIHGLPVVNIDNYAFYQSAVSSVTIPSSVTNIGSSAFAYCRSLTSITIPGSVTTIGTAAFGSCNALATATISPGVVTIRPNAFASTRLSSVTIPNSVTNIGTTLGTTVFTGSTMLTTISVEPANPAYSSLNGVLYNKERTVLLEYPHGKMGAFTIPHGVTALGNNGFYAHQGLTSVTIPDGLTSIGLSAFAYCGSLTNVMLPDSITNIGNSAFNSCRKLARISVPGDVTTIGNYAFSGCTNLSSVTIFNGVATIGVSAFASCQKLAGLIIPASVTSIGDTAFQSCSNLTAVYFKGDAPSLGTNAFKNNNKATVYYLPGTTGWGSNFGERPSLLWNPSFQTGDGSFGVRSNCFGFNISGTENIPILVEACASLANPNWQTLHSCTLTNGSLYLGDPAWSNNPTRFYRIRSP
jgi:hypothetical protein